MVPAPYTAEAETQAGDPELDESEPDELELEEAPPSDAAAFGDDPLDWVRARAVQVEEAAP